MFPCVVVRNTRIYPHYYLPGIGLLYSLNIGWVDFTGLLGGPVIIADAIDDGNEDGPNILNGNPAKDVLVGVISNYSSVHNSRSGFYLEFTHIQMWIETINHQVQSLSFCNCGCSVLVKSDVDMNQALHGEISSAIRSFSHNAIGECSAVLLFE